MTPAEVQNGLKVLRNYYAKDGQPYVLNDVQIGVYLEALAPFSADLFEAAARQWMRSSKWFPALSDLLEILDPRVDPKTAAAMAWSDFETIARRVGAYQGVQFDDPILGEAVKRTFGSWPNAVLMDTEGPAYAIRRNNFLAIYPGLLARPPHQEPVLMFGQHSSRPEQLYRAKATRPLALPAPDKTREVLAEATRRFQLLRQQASVEN